MNGAAAAGNIPQDEGALSATLSFTRVLVNLRVPGRRQRPICLYFIQKMISLWSGCTAGVQDRYRFFS